jgi:hypothetical protein
MIFVRGNPTLRGRCDEWHVDFRNSAAVNDIGKKGLSCEDGACLQTHSRQGGHKDALF